jgi:hypothetical protein
MDPIWVRKLGIAGALAIEADESRPFNFFDGSEPTLVLHRLPA